jgi:hypothetical protein
MKGTAEVTKDLGSDVNAFRYFEGTTWLGAIEKTLTSGGTSGRGCHEDR